MNARVTEATLAKAARVATAEGVCIVIEVRGPVVSYRIEKAKSDMDQPEDSSHDGKPEPW